MVSLSDYIIVEALDVDNLLYKVDNWFSKNADEMTTFSDMIDKFKKAPSIDRTIVSDYAKNFKLKQFVDYMTDNISGTEVSDYLYVFNKIIDTLVGDKSQ